MPEPTDICMTCGHDYGKHCVGKNEEAGMGCLDPFSGPDGGFCPCEEFKPGAVGFKVKTTFNGKEFHFSPEKVEVTFPPHGTHPLEIDPNEQIQLPIMQMDENGIPVVDKIDIFKANPDGSYTHTGTVEPPPTMPGALNGVLPMPMGETEKLMLLSQIQTKLQMDKELEQASYWFRQQSGLSQMSIQGQQIEQYLVAYAHYAQGDIYARLTQIVEEQVEVRLRERALKLHAGVRKTGRKFRDDIDFGAESVIE